MTGLESLNPARYLVAGPGLPPIQRGKIDYVMAGNGLWKRAANRHVVACQQLVACRIPGLPSLEHTLRLVRGRLPAVLLHTLLVDARRRACYKPAEAMYHVYSDDSRLRLAYVPQQVSAARVQYTGGADPAIILDVHSHCEMGAHFSHVDTGDEQGFRFYAVMGHIFSRPEILLRLGIHGDHWTLPIDALFQGPGPFLDVLDPEDSYGYP